MNRPSDLEDFREARPFVRSVLAFLLYLRFGDKPDIAYLSADVFLDQLEKDLQ